MTWLSTHRLHNEAPRFYFSTRGWFMYGVLIVGGATFGTLALVFFEDAGWNVATVVAFAAAALAVGSLPVVWFQQSNSAFHGLPDWGCDATGQFARTAEGKLTRYD